MADLQSVWDRLERDLAEQLAGTTPPEKPQPLPRPDELPRHWPTRGGSEL